MDNDATIVISGAGSGIGRATAVRLHGDGVHVTAVGRREEPLRQLAADLDSGIEVVAADVVEDAAEYSGQVDRHAPYYPITLVGAPTTDVLLYPVEDQIADKVGAMGKIHRHGDREVVSTWYRDVADVALFATTLPADATALYAALRAAAASLVVFAATADPAARWGLRPPRSDARVGEPRLMDAAMR